MTDQSNGPKGQGGFRLDRTISAPTLLTVVCMLGGFWWWGTTLYADLRMTDRENAQDIRTIRNDLSRVENNQEKAAVGVKDDLSKINDKLDRLTDRLLPPQTIPRGWVK